MFRIFVNRKFQGKSHTSHLIIVFAKQKPFLAAALKNWYSWQSSLRGCKDADRNGNVTVGWAGGSELWPTHSLPWAAHLGTARAQVLPSTSGLCHLQILGHLWGSAPFLPCPAEGWQFFTWALKLLFIISHCMAEEWAAAEAASACKPTNLLPEMPACTLHGQQFRAYSFLPDVNLSLSQNPVKKIILFCHCCKLPSSMSLFQGGLVHVRVPHGSVAAVPYMFSLIEQLF